MKAKGELVQGIRGTMHGEIRPMEQGDQFTVSILFPYGDGIPDHTALIDARYRLTVVDIRGRNLRAEYPA